MRSTRPAALRAWDLWRSQVRIQVGGDHRRRVMSEANTTSQAEMNSNWSTASHAGVLRHHRLQRPLQLAAGRWARADQFGIVPAQAGSPSMTCASSTSKRPIEGKANAPLERHLHCGIYRVRPDVKAIVHAHPKWSTFLTMVGESYQPVYAQGSLVYPLPLLDFAELDQHALDGRPAGGNARATGRRR